MKGIVLSGLSDMVVEKHGLHAWDDMLTRINPPSGGSYSIGKTYSDEELMALVQAAAELNHVDVPVFLETFGEYLFPVLAGKYSFFLEKSITLKEFLKSIDNTIHLEVRKLDPNAELPSISYEDPAPDQLVMLYHSPRKLCHLAVGLIHGAAKHFNQTVSVKQKKCIHQGNDHCRLEVTFV